MRHSSPRFVAWFARSWITLAIASLAATVANAQTPPAANVDLTDPANQQVLRAWQQQTGQAIPFGLPQTGINPATGKPAAPTGQPFEFHGQIEFGGYSNRVTNPSGNPALGSMRSGEFGRLVFQGDARSINADQDVTYAQGTFTSTDDRGLQSRQATQINNLQLGRVGPGYQIVLGDVAASFSGLSTNQGLRGLLLGKDFGALTLNGYAGVVAESWEALAGRDARDGQPSRSRNLRDVIGTKAEYKFKLQSASQAIVYATLQKYSDRAGTASAVSPLAPIAVGAVIAPLTTLGGTIASLGSKFTEGNFQLAAELASSHTKDLQNTQDRAAAYALVIDGTYKLGAVSLRAGHHDLGANFVALAQSNLPGVRETYAGADWQITPQLVWGVDARTAVTRIATLAAISGGAGLQPASQSELDSLANRLSYSSTSIPGLAFSLSDTRSQGRDALNNRNRIDTTQLSASFANSVWNTNVLLGQGHARNVNNQAFDANNSNWQLFLGRNWRGASADSGASSWSLGMQATIGQQNQKFLSSQASSNSNNVGLYLQATHPLVGNLSAGWQQFSTGQLVAGAPALKSNSFNIDLSRDFGRHWSAKAYARASERNAADALLQYGERSFGLQGIYKW